MRFLFLPNFINNQLLFELKTYLKNISIKQILFCILLSPFILTLILLSSMLLMVRFIIVFFYFGLGYIMENALESEYIPFTELLEEGW